eukprot:1156965-Pelagomonas_calceolata.AAC.1
MQKAAEVWCAHAQIAAGVLSRKQQVWCADAQVWRAHAQIAAGVLCRKQQVWCTESSRCGVQVYRCPCYGKLLCTITQAKVGLASHSYTQEN